MPQTVKIHGEVSVPGEYTLINKTERVTDLVRRAQGLLPTAYEEGARLMRSQDELGRIDFDLVAALEDPEDSDNLILQPGDSLHIPVFSPTVEVEGAVNSPVTVLYQAGRGLAYYIENAGGFANNADRGRVSVRFANGQARTTSRFLLWRGDPRPGPGSTIIVPVKDPADATDVRGLIRDIVAIAGSVTTLIVVLTR
jgi:protein involved in polysaccharide export with SLBB domain